MDRQISYSGALPLSTEMLLTNRDAYIGLAKLAAGVLGTTTIANGLAVTPTAPASLNVSVAQGEIYQLQACDATAYSDAGTDANIIMKQGVSLSPTIIAIAVPGTPGYSQNYLIEYSLNETDGGATVLNYYNPSNPASPYSGPGNSGASNNTIRQDLITITAKAGIAAPTGTQTTPTPDSGFIGGYVVTVTNGQSTITSTNISIYSTASFINETLTQKISQSTADARYAQQTQIQAGTLVYGLDTGTANAVVSTISPAISSYTTGMNYNVVIANTNTGASTVNFNTIGVVSILTNRGTALQAGMLVAGMNANLFYNGTNFLLTNPASVPGVKTTYTSGSGNYPVPPSAIALKVRGVAGGGGGAGSYSGGGLGTVGGTGGNTTFGSGYTAHGGVGSGTGTGGNGGAITAPGTALAFAGQNGESAVGSTGTINNLEIIGGAGGNSPFFNGGGYQQAGGIQPGTDAIAKSGGGGSGGGGNSSLNSNGGGGGGGGGGFEDLITGSALVALGSSVAYSVGAGGIAGTAGTSGFAGGAGASGLLEITAYFQ